MVVDALAAALQVGLRRVWLRGYLLGSRSSPEKRDYLVKPLTYMNRSGDILEDLFRRTRTGPEDLVVVCDNVDLPPGVCRLKLRGSASGHRGIASIQLALATGEFMRLSVGVGRPASGSDLAAYVLAAPAAEEASDFRAGVERGAHAVLDLLTGSPMQVMNELNRRSGPSPE
jgi:PTH1 family peptidyl-tRNA hydrolase